MREDFRDAWRSLWRRPGVALSGIVTLALAIGVNTTILAVADLVVFRPLPFVHGDRIFVLTGIDPASGRQFGQVPRAALDVLCGTPDLIEGCAAAEQAAPRIRLGAEGAEQIPSVSVSLTYFDVVGVNPHRGRVFGSGDSGHRQEVAMLTYDSWLERFDGDPSVVGRTLQFSGSTLQIVGVLPPHFLFPTPLAGDAALVVPDDPQGGLSYPVVRLRTGVDASLAARRAGELLAAAGVGVGVRFTEAKEVLFGPRNEALTALLVAALLVLLLGIANVVLKMLATNLLDAGQLSIRSALGASRTRIARSFLAQALILNAFGFVLAALVSYWSFAALLQFLPQGIYARAAVGIDRRVLVLSLFAALVAALGVAAFLTVLYWRAGANLDPLRGTPRSLGDRKLTRRVLLPVQVAMALVLGVAALASVARLTHLTSLDVGYDPSNVVALTIGPATRYEQGLVRRRYFEQILTRLHSDPRVVAAGASATTPYSGARPDSIGFGTSVTEPIGGTYFVFPGYFETLDIPILAGRSFTTSDLTGESPFVIVSASAARAAFGARNPIGETVAGARGLATVIGVAGDVIRNTNQSDRAAWYVIPSHTFRVATVLVRLQKPTSTVLAEIRSQAAGVDPNVPVRAAWYVSGLDARLGIATERFRTIVLATLGALALVLVLVGTTGIATLVVRSRLKEFAIRLALGANQRALFKTFVSELGVLVAIGIGAGGGLCWALGRRFPTLQPGSFDQVLPIAIVAVMTSVFLPIVIIVWRLRTHPIATTLRGL
jgi:predicted permease